MNASSEPLAFDIVARIAERAPELRSAERKVAALILDDLAGASRASIGALAEKAEVSIATVTRFAKAVGCQDVRELKLRLAQAAAVGQRFLRREPDDVPDSLAARIFEEVQTTLAHNQGALRAAPVAAAADALAEASMIYVFGMGGGSTALADEMRFRLVRLGRPAASYQDGLLQRMVASTLSKEHVVVALSVTGQTPEMVDSCRLAREYGARVIALTAPASPLGALADWLIPVLAIETDFIYKPSSSRYAMLMALDLLVTELAVKQAGRSRELLRRMKHALDAHRGGGERQPLGD
ncbi:Transcriptional regulator, RpiR family [Caballeronia glathei]|jgi:DNA-binding MurR/RpiR family transcriptional regulator|uniref:Transcriptional regulator n=1 Tax=Caballeronia glathei TaxID=60547 RepID=A0A069Q4U9_9BURK|nr:MULTISPECIES: MurR/RpiR family transcriptional regulator [Burkholderiaceae]KDR44786.1 transcriptional regulator [Caballeronia glathei]TCK42498.1 RpiR family transcriptional regulator [Paraburkholderia sp. BL8N3]CEJ96272.1 Transcriptional regulator, RpiR family [Caballeronia glathei]